MLSLLQVFFEHLQGINGNEFSSATSQYLALLVSNLRHIDMLAATDILLMSLDNQRLSQRNRLQIFDLHLASKRDHMSKLVDLAHGLVEDRRDNSTVSMRRRADVAGWKFELADEGLSFFVERKLQPQTIVIILAAAKAIVPGDLVVASVVSGGGAFRGHMDEHATDEPRRASVAEFEMKNRSAAAQAPPG